MAQIAQLRLNGTIAQTFNTPTVSLGVTLEREPQHNVQGFANWLTGQFGILDPENGQLTPLATGLVSPHDAAFVSTTQSVPEPDSMLGILVFGAVFAGFKLRRVVL